MTRDGAFFTFGLAVGAIAMAALTLGSRPSTWSYAIWYQVNDQMALAVKPDGKIECGPAYRAETLRNLLDGLREMRRTQYCGSTREAGWR